MNLGGIINTTTFKALYGNAGDIDNYKWNMKYKLETLKNGEYQLNIHLILKGEEKFTSKFTNMGIYNSRAIAIELEANKAAKRDYKKAPSFIKKEQVYDDGSFFGERVGPAVSLSDYEDAELALRKKEIDNEKRKENASKYLRKLDAAKNYFAHLCDFVYSEFNRVKFFKSDIDNDAIYEIKRLKLTFGESRYVDYKEVKNERLFTK